MDVTEPEARFEYLIVGLKAFGLTENQIYGILNMLPDQIQRDKLLFWLADSEMTVGSSAVILQAQQIARG